MAIVPANILGLSPGPRATWVPNPNKKPTRVSDPDPEPAQNRDRKPEIVLSITTPDRRPPKPWSRSMNYPNNNRSKVAPILDQINNLHQSIPW